MANLGCLLATAALFCAQVTLAQNPPPDLFAPQAPATKKNSHAKPTPEPSSGPRPAAEIALQQLGFAPPSAFHLGDRWVQSSLDFLDEDHLLFTFRVPGLIVRDHAAREAAEAGSPVSEGRNIRALVLQLPSGQVEAEALWHLHDYATYLWPLTDGRFLLRDRNLVQVGDASLHMEPFLRFPGAVKYLELDPRQTVLVTQNLEPLLDSSANGADAHRSNPPGTIAGDLAANHNPTVGPGSDASPSVLPIPHPANPNQPDLATYLRIFRMSDRKILTTTHIPGNLIHIAIDNQGYYDVARTSQTTWQILYHGFYGSETVIDQIESSCSPPLDVLAPGVVLVSACDDSGGRRLTAVTRDTRRLWQIQSAATHIWPLLTSSANGLRVARATLDTSHPVTPSSPLDEASDIRSQTIQVFDVATGKLAFTGLARPILDGGGNFALSPSGNRFAVLNNGAIQVYNLAPAPALPAITTSTP